MGYTKRELAAWDRTARKVGRDFARASQAAGLERVRHFVDSLSDELHSVIPEGQLWLDTSRRPYRLHEWRGGKWRVIGKFVRLPKVKP